MLAALTLLHLLWIRAYALRMAAMSSSSSARVNPYWQARLSSEMALSMAVFQFSGADTMPRLNRLTVS